jgi:hypothetical protein
MAWELDNLTNPFGYKKGAQKPVNNMSGLLDFAMQANQYIPVSGDIQSGILAANDVAQGNYANAALNAAGLLPFVPSLGAVTKNDATLDVALSAPMMGEIIKNSDDLFHGSLGSLVGDLRTGKGTLGEGFYLTNTQNQAALYPKLHAKLKKIENPEIVVTPMKTTAKNIYELNDLPVGGVDVNKLKKLGYDGISYKNELMIFDPKNVKIKN